MRCLPPFLLPALLAAVLTAALAWASPDLLSADAGAWAAFHANAQHTGLSPVPGPYSPVLAWYVPLSDDVDASPAIGSDGTIYVASTDGTVVAINPDGSTKWVFGAGARIYGSPVLSNEGQVLIGDVSGRFRALNAADGSAAWVTAGLGSVRGTAAVGRDGTIYIGTDAPALVALDGSTGQEKFRLAAGDAVVAAPAIGPAGDVFWGGLDGRLRRMSPAGDVRWEVALDGPIAQAPSVGADGTLYVGAGGSLLAISPDTGSILWRVGAGAPVMTSPAIGADGTIYAGADNGQVLAVAPSGNIRWQYQTGATVRSSPAVGPDGLLYVGSADSNLYVLDQNGRVTGTFHALDGIFSSPAIGPTGMLYVGSRDNHFYALRDNVRTFTQSPPDRLGGDLVRDPSTGKVYVLVDGQRRYIPDPVTQQLLGLGGRLPASLTAAELVRYPEGPALPPLAEGALIQTANGPVYVIRGGKRVWIPSPEAFAAGGYTWDRVIPVDDRVARSIPLDLQEGMALKGTGERVYLYSGGQRRWISSLDAFVARGLTWSQVHYLSDAALQSLPEGPPL